MERVQSIFGDYATKLQALVDVRMDKFKVPFFQRYFGMGTPQMTLTYANIIGRSRIEAAASVVAHGAASPLRSRAGLETLSGKVAAIKVKRPMDEEQVRNYMTLQAMPVSDEAKKMQILRYIWEDVVYVGNAVIARIDYMAAQALNKGVISINTTTNPDGVVPGDIDLLVSTSQKGVVGGTNENRQWSETNATTMKVITDIKTIVRAQAKKGIRYEKILIHPEKLWEVLESTQVINLIKGLKVVTAGEIDLDLATVNTYMKIHGLPIFETVDVYTAVEKNGIVTTVEPWDKRYITFVPAGPQGQIHNSMAIEELKPVAAVSYAKYMNALISKWSETEPYNEYTRGEISAFPGLETADSIYILDTGSHTTYGG